MVEELSEAPQARLVLVVVTLVYLKVQYHKEMPLLLQAVVVVVAPIMLRQDGLFFSMETPAQVVV